MRTARTLAATLAVVQRDINIREERRERARKDEAWASAAQTETLALEASRGVELVQPTQQTGQPRKPLRRKTGLQWLFDKGRLGSPDLALSRFDAGVKYGSAYRTANDAPIGSCIAHLEGGLISGSSPSGAQPLRIAAAQDRLVKARIIALRNNADMIKACDAILGGERTPLEYAGTQRPADRAEAVLLIALDLLGDYFETGSK